MSKPTYLAMQPGSLEVALDSSTGTSGLMNAPTECPQCRQVVIRNPMGLHMRPAAAFASMAQGFSGEVSVLHAERRVNGKSWLDLLLLAAPEGTELTLEVSGPGAMQAIESLAEQLASEAPES
jgi:phosphotransferase system HPr (HPr) family protein